MGNFEQPKHTGASAAWPGASCVSLRSKVSRNRGTNLVQADDILTPEELAAYAFSLRSPIGSRNRGLKVPDSWVYENTRGRCRNPIPCLRRGRDLRFKWAPLIRPTRATWLTATKNPAGKTGSSEPPKPARPVSKTVLKLNAVSSRPAASRKHVGASPTFVQCGLSREGGAKFYEWRPCRATEPLAPTVAQHCPSCASSARSIQL